MTEEELKNLITDINNGDKEALAQLTALAETGITNSRSGHKEALAQLKALAESGNIEAQYELGYLYSKNYYAIESHGHLSMKFLKMAADNGHLKALYRLGFNYRNGVGTKRDLNIYFEILQECADKGLSDAQVCLAGIYDQTDFFGSVEFAKYYYAKSIEDSNMPDKFDFYTRLLSKRIKDIERDRVEAESLQYGPNYEKAVNLYRLAARQGNAKALYFLGECYEYGRGVMPNYTTALELYNKAAEKEYDIAIAKLGNCYFFGKCGVAINYKCAVEFYTKAATKKYAQAQHMLAVCFYDGKGVEQDYAKAFEFARASAINSFYTGAYTVLGDCYFYGHGVEQDLKMAKEWYQKAANYGNTDARLKLLNFDTVSAGLGFTFEETALEKAAKEGYKEAQATLQEMRENKQTDRESEFSIANAGMPHDVFISWNHRDIDFKNRLVAGIEKNLSPNGKSIYAHYRAWESDRDASGEIEECIKNAIEQSKLFILILSENSVKSEWVKLELKTALNKIDSGKWRKENLIIICLNSLKFNAGKFLNSVSDDVDNVFSEIAGYSASFDGMFVKTKGANLKDKTIKDVIYKINNAIGAEAVKKYVASLKDEDTFRFTVKGQMFNLSGENFVNAILPFDENGYVNRSLYDVSGNRYFSNEIFEENDLPFFICGEGGMGKSLFISSLIKHYFTKNANFFVRVNVLEFKDEINTKNSLAEVLNSAINSILDGNSCSDGSFFRARGKDGKNKMKIILDGLDEIDGQTCDNLLKLLARYVKVYPKDRFIFAARTPDRFNDINAVFGGSLKLYYLKGLNAEEQSALYDNIIKANEKFKISKTDEFGRAYKQDFFEKLSRLTDDVKTNPFILSNLIFVYLRSNGKNFPQTRFEVIENSVEMFLNCSEKSKVLSINRDISDYIQGEGKLEKLLCYISYQKAWNGSGQSMQNLICDFLETEEGANSKNNIRQLGKMLYEYLNRRSILSADRITHDLFTTYFACCYLYNIIYKRVAGGAESGYITFNNEQYFLKNVQSNGNFKNGDGACPEVSAELIMKLDSEIWNLFSSERLKNRQMDEEHSSYNTFNRTLDIALRQKGFSDEAIKIICGLLSDNADSACELYYDKFIRQYLNNPPA